MKILIVEDDSITRSMLRRLLEPYGECHTAEEGNTALSSFTAAHEAGSPFDVICLDIMMPGIGGQEVLESIRLYEDQQGINPDQACRVIMITSSSDSGDVFEAFSGGCEAYLIKPIDPAKLKQTLLNLGIKSTKLQAPTTV